MQDKSINSETILLYQNPNIKLGFHISKMPKLSESFIRMLNVPLSSYQIYLSSGRAWEQPKIDSTELIKTRHILNRCNKYSCVHGCLLYNLAGSVNYRDDPLFQKKLNGTYVGLMAELDIAATIDSGVVVHIGSCKYKDKGIETIVKTIEAVISDDNSYTKQLSKGVSMSVEEIKSKRKIILENSAGEGNKIGSNLDEIAKIIKNVKKDVRDRVKVCIDTAHIFGAGQYDLGKGQEVERFFNDFDSKIGIEKLELFHLNDSRVQFKSKKDRHENLGLGYMFGEVRDDGCNGLDGLKTFIEYAEKYSIPLIGEPPAKDKDGGDGAGELWDYYIVKNLVNLEEEIPLSSGCKKDGFVCNC